MRWLVAGFFVFALGIGLTCPVRGAEGETTIQGKLLQLPGGGLALKTPERDYSLTTRTTWMLHTLHDKPLANRQIRVEGVVAPDGKLKVNHFWTVRDGKLYRVRYFCEVCNIEAFEPGNCVCCQEPVEFQETPVPETGK